MRLRLGIESEIGDAYVKNNHNCNNRIEQKIWVGMSGLRNPIGDNDYWIFDPRSFAHLIVLKLTALPEEVSLSFACSIFAYSRKTLHESSKIFVEHAQHVARILFRTQA